MSFVSYVKRGATESAKEAIAQLVIKTIQKDILDIQEHLKTIDENEIARHDDIILIKSRLEGIDNTFRRLSNGTVSRGAV